MVMCIAFDLSKAYVFHDIEEMKQAIIPLASETGRTYEVTELGGSNRFLGWVRPSRFGPDSARFIPASQSVDPRKLLDLYNLVDLAESYSLCFSQEDRS